MMLDVLRSLAAGEHVDFMSIIMQLAAVIFVIFCILPVHEWAHAYTACKLGDYTAKNSGRLTFNPIASFDPMGCLFILLLGFGWAKPVPVNPINFKNRKRDMAIVALAGPVSNLLCALIGSIALHALAAFSKAVSPYAGIFLSFYIQINVGLAVFNLIPVPPLDGSRILAAFLPDKAVYNYYRYQNIAIMVVFVLLFFGYLDVPLKYLESLLLRGISWISALPFKAFGLL